MAYCDPSEALVKVETTATGDVAGIAASIGDVSVGCFNILLIGRTARYIEVAPVAIQPVQVIGPLTTAAVHLKDATVELRRTNITVFNAAISVLWD